MALSPEYQALIDSITKQYQQNRAQGEASGISEAQRRGLVNPTGTSDIEMGLRQSKTAPIEQAYQSNVGNIMAQLAQDEAQKKFVTSERMGQQDWQGGQNQYNRDLEKYLQQNQQGWQTGENALGRTWEETMANKERQWNLDDAKRGKRERLKGSLYKLINPGTELVGNVLGNYLGSKK